MGRNLFQYREVSLEPDRSPNRKRLPGYQHKIYAYRATKKGDSTLIDKMKFSYKVDNYTKFVHVNVELIPAKAKEEILEEEEDDILIPEEDLE